MFRVVGVIGLTAAMLLGCSSGSKNNGGGDNPEPENTAPVITLLGDSSVNVVVGSQYEEQGATAEDAEDGNISTLILIDDSELNLNAEGSYSVYYSVEDSGGLTDSEVRQVTVIAANSNPDIGLTIPKTGFTTVVPSGDSQIIYVSSSEGDDANTGLSKLDPVQTFARARSLVRDGFPDWIVLKSGDVWEESIGWNYSGRSVQEPMVITSYGFDERPLFKTGTSSGIRMQGGGGANLNVSNLVISGLHFLAHTRDPNSVDFVSTDGNSGFVFLRDSDYLLIEDNVFQFYKDNLNIQGSNGSPAYVPKNINIRKNLFLDAYSEAGVGHSQGLFVHLVEDVLIEGNIFDVCGYNEDIPTATQTKFNHCMYIQSSVIRSVVKDNIVMNASSHGVQQRPGYTMTDNFFYKTAIGVLVAAGQFDGSTDYYRTVRGNVILKSRDINGESRGWGMEIQDSTTPNGEVTNNIVAHNISPSRSDDRAIISSNVFPQTGNVVYDWGPESEDGSMYVDPERTIEEFDALHGGDGTEESFINALRSQSRANWNEDYEVGNILQFFRDGFEPAEG